MTTAPGSPADSDGASGGWLTAGRLHEALEVAERWLAANRDAVNAVNVYPVPDGDTGTNMLLTWRAALRAAADARNASTPGGGAVGPYLAAMARGALLGARGNSGVILSQMLAGLARACDQAQALDGRQIAAALTSASETAYAAVTKPVEGTMLTVMKDAAAAARAVGSSDAVSTLRAAVEEAQASVMRTPELLARLRDAGVVDAGGLGVAVLLEGWRRGLTGEALPEAPAVAGTPVNVDAVEHEGHGYCTEFVVVAATGHGLDRASIEQALVAAGGESILVVGDHEALHVHVHLVDPGPALSIGAASGALASVKVDNMQAQHEAWLAAKAHEPDADAPLPAIGLVAVARGAGIAGLFRDLGATRVLDGGETGKASAGELLEAARGAGRDHVVLLPNDKDVLMAAEAAAGQAPGFITVIPTRSVAAGLAAAVAYQGEGDAMAVVEEMREAAAAVRCVELSRSVRTATVDGVAVREGDAIALVDDVLVAACATLDEALLTGFAHAGAAEAELATLYLGAGVDAVEGARSVALVVERWPHLDVQTVEGGQPHYPFLAGIE